MSKELKFNEKLHEYRLDKKVIPSVTQILTPISNELYKFIDKRILDAKADIGTEVHKCIEFYCNYELLPSPSEDQRVLNYFNSYLQFREDYKDQFIKTLATEFQEYYEDEEITYGGQIDNITLFKDDGITLIDYKTVASLNPSLVALQEYGYKLIAEQKMHLSINKFKVLLLHEDGYELIDLTHLVKEDPDTAKLFRYFYEFDKLMDEYGVKNTAIAYSEKF